MNKNFNLVHNLSTIRGIDFTRVFLITVLSHGAIIFDLVTLTLKFDILLN